MARRRSSRWIYSSRDLVIESVELIEADLLARQEGRGRDFVLINGEYHGRADDASIWGSLIGQHVSFSVSQSKRGADYWYAMVPRVVDEEIEVF